MFFAAEPLLVEEIHSFHSLMERFLSLCCEEHRSRAYGLQCCRPMIKFAQRGPAHFLASDPTGCWGACTQSTHALEIFRVGVCLTAVMSMLDRVAPVPAQVYDCNKAHFVVVVGCFPLCFWESSASSTNIQKRLYSSAFSTNIQQFPYSFRCFWEVFSTADRLDNSTKQQSGWAWLGMAGLSGCGHTGSLGQGWVRKAPQFVTRVVLSHQQRIWRGWQWQQRDWMIR